MKDKFQLSSRKEGLLSVTSSGEALSRLATSMRSTQISSNLFLRPRLPLSLSAVYPKGITFPLGSCLSGTNSRNSRRLLPAERQFFFGKSPYQWFEYAIPSTTLNLDFAATRHASNISSPSVRSLVFIAVSSRYSFKHSVFFLSMIRF